MKEEVIKELKSNVMYNFCDFNQSNGGKEDYTDVEARGLGYLAQPAAMQVH